MSSDDESVVQEELVSPTAINKNVDSVLDNDTEMIGIECDESYDTSEEDDGEKEPPKPLQVMQPVEVKKVSSFAPQMKNTTMFPFKVKNAVTAAASAAASAAEATVASNGTESIDSVHTLSADGHPLVTVPPIHAPVRECFSSISILTHVKELITTEGIPGCYLVGSKGNGKYTLVQAAARLAGFRTLLLHGSPEVGGNSGQKRRRKSEHGRGSMRKHPSVRENGASGDDDNNDDDDECLDANTYDCTRCTCDGWGVSLYRCGGGDECDMAKVFQTAMSEGPVVFYVNGILSRASVRAVRRAMNVPKAPFVVIGSVVPVNPAFYIGQDLDEMSASCLYDDLTLQRSMALWLPPPCLATSVGKIPERGVAFVRSVLLRLLRQERLPAEYNEHDVAAALAWCSSTEIVSILAVAMSEHKAGLYATEPTYTAAVSRVVSNHEQLYVTSQRITSNKELLSPFTPTERVDIDRAASQNYRVSLFALRNVDPYVRTTAGAKTRALLVRRWAPSESRINTSGAHRHW